MSAKHPQFSNAELRALALKDPALFEAWSVREAINQDVKERIRFLAGLLEPERPELTDGAIKSSSCGEIQPRSCSVHTTRCTHRRMHTWHR